MADIAFRAKPTFGANVANKSINARPAIGQPTGPRGIPCSVLCPPDPPPTPTPLGIVAVVADEFAGFAALSIEFDAPPVLSGIPNWGWTGGDAPQLVALGHGGPNFAKFIFDVVPPSAVVVSADATGVHSASGGAVVPGTYPVTEP